jgi:rubrerythrin
MNMSKGLEALQKLRDLVEYLTRIDYVPSDLRNEVKELLIKSYKDSNGYFSQIEEALKHNEPMKVDSFDTSSYYGSLEYFKCHKCGNMNIEVYYNYCPMCGQKLDWSDEK